MMRGIINKGKAAVFTIWVMSLVSTNADPKLWQVAVVAIMAYETVLLGLETWQRETRKARKRRNIAAGREDMKRLEKERLYWLKREAG